MTIYIPEKQRVDTQDRYGFPAQHSYNNKWFTPKKIEEIVRISTAFLFVWGVVAITNYDSYSTCKDSSDLFGRCKKVDLFCLVQYLMKQTSCPLNDVVDKTGTFGLTLGLFFTAYGLSLANSAIKNKKWTSWFRPEKP